MHKTSKAYAILTAAILMLLPLLSAIPVPVSATMTGYTVLYRDLGHKIYSNHNLYFNGTGVTSSYPTPIRSIYDDVKDNGSLVIINMTNVDTHGANAFWLWISPNPGTDINVTTDSCYAGPLITSNIAAPPTVANNYTGYKDPKSGEYFWLGNNAIMGPLTTAIILPKGMAYWVKVSTSSLSPPASSDVSVSANTWLPYPTIKISPSKGPVGTTVTVTGQAWDSAKLVNISYSLTVNDTAHVQIKLLAPSAAGTFTSTFIVPEDKTFNYTETMHVNAYYNGTSNYFASQTFSEWEKTWRQIGKNVGYGGNNWNLAGGTALGVMTSIYISANYTNVRGTVNLYWDYNTTAPVTLASSITVNSVTGFFNVSVTVPNAKMGTHKITLADLTWTMNATVKVGPSLILNPTTGQIGITVVATGYGFPYGASGHDTNVTLTWDFTVWPSGTPKSWYNIFTGTNGLFSTTFTVPSGVGGVHNVTAVTNGTSTTAWALFTVIPTLTLSATSAANNGTVVTVSGTGLMYNAYYDLQINQKDYISNNTRTPVYFNATTKGVMASFSFVVDSSFNPGVVAVTLYNGVSGFKLPNRAATVLLTVTGQTQTAILNAITAIAKNIAGNFTAMQTTLTTISTATSQISGISTSVSSIQTSANQISTLSTSVYLVIVLSLIAAVASIVAVITLQRKVA